MSWILGIFGEGLTPGHEHACAALHPAPRHSIRTPRLYLAAGGIAETCLHRTQKADPSNGWLVAGLGLETSETRTRILAPDDWAALLHTPSPELGRLFGHCVALRWTPDTLECLTDQLGMRTLYVTTLSGLTAFSTRLDWLARLRGQAEIDPSVLGGMWLLLNQLTSDSPLKGISRVGPSGRVAITPASITMQSHPWTPRDLSTSDESLVESLRALARAVGGGQRKWMIGLSGGMDSRVLLALLLSGGGEGLEAFALGDPADPDARLSAAIARAEGIVHHHYHDDIPEPDALLALAREYVGRMGLTSPCSTILKLRFYERMYRDGFFFIDGGFGEIGRRQLFVRLSRMGRDVLRSGDPQRILRCINQQRAPVFSAGFGAQMHEGALRQIETAFRQMPKPAVLGVENTIDLFAVRTRFPNFGGAEQARVDEEIIGYTPYAQPSFLHHVFATPLDLRRNGKLYRTMIRFSRPSLERFPLVKGTTTYPYRLHSLPALIVAKSKEKLGMCFHDRAPAEMLLRLQEFMRDTAHSEAVRSAPYYDHAYITRTVEKFYAGNHALAPQLEWWLTFELWRQGLGGGTAQSPHAVR